ncbi:MFS general substrate transporter [Annulohypoxylon maeteangense]|uniref:MFS general substrate transporter n=1 Tax=Annulohypoxylon maeteangense TaxID=1927788 RepID=UPI0020073115|nr:MFS general substrate transporter [Annulohypoxylon maeteangense]KAI0883547.1 MFS general substrate transporter [Annulohypoxylon maeteangense]
MGSIEKVECVEVQISHSSSISTSESHEVSHQYTDEEYKRLRRKIDRYLLPLMWLCHGLQQVDKGSVGTQATFGLREDTGLVGQQFAWLTTMFYLTYLIFELPSVVLLQRYPMGRVLSLYVICWGIVVLCIGFAQNFAQLVTLRALQGMFECSISPGFLLVVGTWYKTREHPSRALVFQSGFAGMSIMTDAIVYGIGSVTNKNPDFQAWRYMSFFLGSVTVLAGAACLLFLGTPSEVRWLSAEEKKIAVARVMENNTGHDRTGFKDWKWDQARECLTDPTFWFAGLNATLNAVPNGALTSFSGILNTTFGFTNLQVLILNIPKYCFTALYFVLVGVVATKKKNTRMWIMMLSNITPIVGFLLIAILPNDPQYKWTKWVAHFITSPYITSTFFAWSLVPSNVAGRTKRTLCTTITFVGYCVGNMTGTQIFRAKDAPRYVPGLIACTVCLTAQVVVIFVWRMVYVMRNRRLDMRMSELGITEEDRIKAGKEIGESDCTDLHNPFFRYAM